MNRRNRGGDSATALPSANPTKRGFSNLNERRESPSGMLKPTADPTVALATNTGMKTNQQQFRD